MKRNLLFLGFFFVTSALGQSTDLVSEYDSVKAANGIWAFIAPEPRFSLASGNSIAIEGDDGVLVVDTGMIPSLTRRMIDEIKQKTGKPVRYVVNTHWHWDHNFGNFVYRDAYPNVVIISTPFTRASIAEFNSKMLAGAQQRGAAAIEKLRQRVESGKMGQEQLATERIHLGEVERAIPEITGGRIELPNATFTDALTIHLGSREVDIRFPGRANTAGDAIVYVPDAKTLITGDLLVGPIPYATGAYVADWIAAMKKLDAMDASVVIPGHGPVEHDKTHLHMVTALLETTLAQVQESVRSGLTLDETRKKLDIAKYRDAMTAGIASRQRNFHDYFEEPIVETIYKQLKGEPTSESPFGG